MGWETLLPVPGCAAEGLFAAKDAVLERQAEHIARLDCDGRGGAVADGESELARVGVVRPCEGNLDLDKDFERAERNVPHPGEEWETLVSQREGQHPIPHTRLYL